MKQESTINETAKAEKQLGTRISKETYDAFIEAWNKSGMTQQAFLEKGLTMFLNREASEAFPGSKTDIETFNSSVAVLNNLYLKSVKAREDFAAVAEEQRHMFLAEAERANADLKAENEVLKKALEDGKRQLAEQQKAASLAVREKDAALLQRKNGDETIAILNEKIHGMEKSKELLEAAEQKVSELQSQLDAANQEFRQLSKEHAAITRKYLRNSDDKDGEIEALKTKIDVLRTQLINAKIKPVVDGEEDDETEIISSANNC